MNACMRMYICMFYCHMEHLLHLKLQGSSELIRMCVSMIMYSCVYLCMCVSMYLCFIVMWNTSPISNCSGLTVHAPCVHTHMCYIHASHQRVGVCMKWLNSNSHEGECVHTQLTQTKLCMYEMVKFEIASMNTSLKLSLGVSFLCITRTCTCLRHAHGIQRLFLQFRPLFFVITPCCRGFCEKILKRI